MKVERIEIENYKGFKKCDVSFHPNMNVFIGSNASGKSTLLTAITKSICGFTKKFVDLSNSNLVITDNDINYNSNYTSILGFLSSFSDSDLDIKSYVHKGIVTEKGKETFNTVSNQLEYLKREINKEISISPITIPIVKFYPANRVSLLAHSNLLSTTNKIYKISQLETWSNIYHDNLSYSSFAKWFIENENKELRLQREHRDFDIQNPALKSIRIALSKTFELLNFGQYKIVSKEIKREGSSTLKTSLILLNEKTGIEEEINNKSDGEKAIIALIADIAYNLSLAKDFTVDEDFLNSPGIVLIDEIETHLHPKWQREILPILTELFPNIQFFVATHSPQIVASVPSDSVFVCDNFSVESIHLKTLGEDTNSILKYIFEATERPKEYINLIEEMDILINENRPSEKIRDVILKIEQKYNSEDKASSLSNLIDELKIKLSAYEFERDYEENN